MNHSVQAWEETITLPTYTPPPADLNPMFLERRVNQGTSGRVHPNPFTDKVNSASEPRDYLAVYLENEYIRLMVLPQVGGRIHEAVDKTNGYPFIYRQHVIKPALIGLFGSWISGGVEFNWPQHHRPSTFMPVNHLIESSPDGSVTVWLSEHEPMDRMKGMVGLCLRPGKAFLEMKAQLYNRTPFVQTFLWWVNVGVHTHEQYQVVFPPDVTQVTDHSKRSMAHYPIMREPYYGIDYAAAGGGDGTDVSWYKNIPVPSSYFAYESSYDFFGGYDHRHDAGVIHVASHHISPGKKMFTWGAGEYAKGWEANLTDADGPYIELMAGVYTDNQPDFSWLQPYETKTFSQIWYPVQQIGPAKNANRRAAVNVEMGGPANGPTIRVGVAVTEAFERAKIGLFAQHLALAEQVVDLAPGRPFVAEVKCPDGVKETDLLLRVCDSNGCEVIRYRPQAIEEKPLPEAKTPPPPPEAFDSVEELYLTGLHLEQYRHPTIDPEPYWEMALARDPADMRCHNALGLSQLRRGLFAQAEAHFRTAVDRLTRRNPNPRDGEPYYNLGMALKWQGRLDEAYAAFYKGIWSYAWQAAGYYALAEIDCQRRDWVTALEHLDRSLLANALNMKARNLKAAALRKLGRLNEAADLCAETVRLDPLDMGSRNELALQSKERGDADAQERVKELSALMHTPHRLSEIQAHLDMAYDYANAGLWMEASDVLARLVGAEGRAFPTVLYALGYFAYQQGLEEKGSAFYRQASAQPADYCFPARLEEILILQHAQAAQPDDPRIAYYLGNLYYDKKRYDEAIANWEQAVKGEPGFSIPWRNLGIACYNVRRDPAQAIACYERAFQASPQDGRVLSELDQLLTRAGVSASDRLARLEAHLDLVRDRDDLSVELASLYNQTGQPQKALDYLLSRRFHPWEGGTGRVLEQYIAAHTLLGRTALDSGDAAAALAHLEAAQATCPDNLGERKHLLWPVVHIHYYIGLARQRLGDTEGAKTSFQKVLAARQGLSEVTYYQALALRRLGDAEGARARLEEMLATATRRQEEEARSGFATSVPQFVFAEEDLQTRMRIHYTCLIGLAHLGLGHTAEAQAAFKTVLAHDPGHLVAGYGLREAS